MKCNIILMRLELFILLPTQVKLSNFVKRIIHKHTVLMMRSISLYSNNSNHKSIFFIMDTVQNVYILIYPTSSGSYLALTDGIRPIPQRFE